MIIKWMIFSFLTSTARAIADPCINAIPLKNVEVRGTRCDGKTLDKLICDRQFAEGWYKAKLGNEMLQMPTTCPDVFACGTFGGIWLNDSYPEDVNSSKVVSVCRRGTAVDKNQCCAEKFQIKIKHCGNFYAFRLKYTSTCYQAYCFGGHECLKLNETSSTQTTSQTSTQSIVVTEDNEDLCMTAIPLHTVALRGKGCNGTNFDVFICDRHLIEGWYKAGHDNDMLQMPTTCPDLFGCGTIKGVWLNGTHPVTVNTTRTIPACAWGTSTKGNKCCAYSFPIHVKHCGYFFAYYLTTKSTYYHAYCFVKESITYTSSSRTVSTIAHSREVQGYSYGFVSILLVLAALLLILIWIITCIFSTTRNRETSRDLQEKLKEYPKSHACVFLYQEANWKSKNMITT